MAELAIKGHRIQGGKVINLLETLGGKNKHRYFGYNDSWVYYINKEGFITLDFDVSKFSVFTLEEFIKKFPYKVGNRVRVADYESEVRIDSMSWNGYEIQYQVFTNEIEWYSAEELNKYNEIYKEEAMKKEISGAIVDRFICLEGYDFYDDKGNIIKTKEITMKKKQPEYLKTYVECAKLLGCFGAAHIDGYKGELLDKFQELLICRDAYWKIAGNWKPDWEDTSQSKHSIWFNNEGICLKSNRVSYSVQHILTFQTEEIRDAFYENFKELIGECKELL